MEEHDVEKASKAQSELCNEAGKPMVAPSSGRCWSCQKNIYELCPENGTGVSVREARTKFITGCPHCHRSYVG